MVDGAVLNATAFIDGNYLARALGGGDKVALDKSAMTKLSKIIKRLTPNTRATEHNFSTGSRPRRKRRRRPSSTNTDYAFKLYNQAHPDEQMVPPKEPNFSDFYQPSEQQKKGELAFVGPGALALGYAAFRFL